MAQDEKRRKTPRPPPLDRGVKAVFFDAGGTLFRPYPSVGHVYARTARKHGVAVTPAWVEGRFQDAWRRVNGLAGLKAKNERTEKHWWGALVRRVFGGKFSPGRFHVYFEELYDLFAQPVTWRLFPETLPVLKNLKSQGFQTGVVSNWDSRLFKLCDDLGVTRYMDFVLASAVEGAAKPEKKFFQKALSLAQVEPHQALHVGDTFREDYWGATQAGLQAALICRNHPAPDGVTAIRSLREVRGLL